MGDVTVRDGRGTIPVIITPRVKDTPLRILGTELKERNREEKHREKLKGPCKHANALQIPPWVPMSASNQKLKQSNVCAAFGAPFYTFWSVKHTLKRLRS